MRAIIHWHLPTIFNVQRSAGSHRLMHTPHTYPSNFAHAAVVQSFSMARWKSAAFSRVSYAESAKGGGQRWLMTTEGAVRAFEQYVKGRSLSICPSIRARSSGGDVGVQTLLLCLAKPTISPILPPLQPSDTQAPLYLLRFHYPGCLFRHSNVSVAY